ncbi:MAG TPA: phosphatidylserine decarboxylase family protein [Vicinamibacterales bacterium]|nr:phosphatidylserine decarboxylase family protein [Vicinamibacterales bacterium]
MRIDPAGWPFILGGLVLAIVALWLFKPLIGITLLIVTTFFLFFFRDPDRRVVAPDTAVLSPADGRVMVAGPSTSPTFSSGQWQQISIFLSPMDVHVNRLPVGGRVVAVKYHPGRFLPAYRSDAGELNEYTEVTIDHGGQMVVVRQIVGILARRIVCRIKEGDVVKAGDRFGVMKFGSRMDVFLPREAALQTRVGEKVVGGVTVLAALPDARAHTAEGQSHMSLVH